MPCICPVIHRQTFYHVGNFPNALIYLRLRRVDSIEKHQKLGINGPSVSISHALDALPHPIWNADNDLIKGTARAVVAHAACIQATLPQINTGNWPYRLTWVRPDVHDLAITGGGNA